MLDLNLELALLSMAAGVGGGYLILRAGLVLLGRISRRAGLSLDDRGLTSRRAVLLASGLLTLAGDLVALFQRHVRQTRGALAAGLREYEGDRLDYPVIRGLAALLEAPDAPETPGHHLLLAAECLQDADRSALDQGVQDAAIQCLLAAMWDQELEIRTQAEAGRLLGWLGDPRPDVTCDVPAMVGAAA